MTREDPRFTRVTEICLALPEATRQDDLGQQGAVFKVRRKTFAYYHHNDKNAGIVAVSGRVPWKVDGRLAAPARYSMPHYVRGRDWIALRLDQGEIDWGEVRDLVSGSYRLVAAKPLVLQLDVAGWLSLSKS